jgi:DNA-directed RNA polymerase subunit beta'
MSYKQHFDGLMVNLASPEHIEQWSHGSVESPDTINYRTGKPKSKGLFCESIFGPVRNFECSCGKYKGVRYQGIVCEKCGVEVASSRVRRERMGHIDLASPVVHARYRNNTSGGVHYLLGLSGHEVDRILAFVKYVCVEPISDAKREELKTKIDDLFESKTDQLKKLYEEEITKNNDTKSKKKQDMQLKELKKIYDDNYSALDTERNRVKSLASTFDFGATILESDYRNFFYQFGDDVSFKSGPDALLTMLKQIDVQSEVKKHIETFHTIKSKEKKKKTFALIKLLVNLSISGIKPEYMVLKKLPVIPPDLRPVVQLEG